MWIWWSDEWMFKVEEIFNYNRKSYYYARENKYQKKIKPNRMKGGNVWAAIRGDGKVVYRILNGKQDTEKYTDMVSGVFLEMENKISFLQQDGGSHHWSEDGIEWLNANWKDRWG